MSKKRAHGYWNRVGVARPFSPFVLVERARVSLSDYRDRVVPSSTL